MNVVKVDQLKSLLSQETHNEAIILDVRTRGEFNNERIVGTTNIPLDEIEKHIDELKQYKHVYIHCNSGNRSQQACQKLSSIGLDNLVNVEGGIQAWKSAGFPIFRSTKARLPIMQQVQIVTGSLVVTGVVLSELISSWLLGISAFVGMGLVYAGLSGTCTMGLLLSRMPWNR